MGAGPSWWMLQGSNWITDNFFSLTKQQDVELESKEEGMVSLSVIMHSEIKRPVKGERPEWWWVKHILLLVPLSSLLAAPSTRFFLRKDWHNCTHTHIFFFIIYFSAAVWTDVQWHRVTQVITEWQQQYLINSIKTQLTTTPLLISHKPYRIMARRLLSSSPCSQAATAVAAAGSFLSRGIWHQCASQRDRSANGLRIYVPAWKQTRYHFILLHCVVVITCVLILSITVQYNNTTEIAGHLSCPCRNLPRSSLVITCCLNAIPPTEEYTSTSAAKNIISFEINTANLWTRFFSLFSFADDNAKTVTAEFFHSCH